MQEPSDEGVPADQQLLSSGEDEGNLGSMGNNLLVGTLRYVGGSFGYIKVLPSITMNAEYRWVKATERRGKLILPPER